MGWKPPNKAKRDGNEAEIVDAFRKMGFAVELTDKPLDLIVGKDGSSYLVEVKNGPKAPLTEDQKRFFASWKGQAAIVRSVADVVAFCSEIKARKSDENLAK